MRHAAAALALMTLLTACNEPEQARDRVPGEALQSFDANRPPAFEDAPSYQVREAIRSAALEVRTDSALYQAAVMDQEDMARHAAQRETDMLALHHAFPFNTWIRLSHQETGEQVEVRIVSAGLFEGPPELATEMNSVIEVSPEAARRLGLEPGERVPVWVEVIEWAP